MAERIEYLRIVLRYNGYKPAVLTVKDINNPEIDGYAEDNSNAWFFLHIIRQVCKENNYDENSLLDDIFPR